MDQLYDRVQKIESDVAAMKADIEAIKEQIENLPSAIQSAVQNYMQQNQDLNERMRKVETTVLSIIKNIDDHASIPAVKPLKRLD